MDTARRVDEHFLADLDEILAWAAERGIKRRTRFHIYRDNITWLRAHDDEPDRPRIYAQLSGEGRLTEMLSTMAESIELAEVIPTLRQHGVNIPEELLRRVFLGPRTHFRRTRLRIKPGTPCLNSAWGPWPLDKV